MRTKFWTGRVKIKDHSEDQGVDDILGEQSWRLWIGFIRLKIKVVDYCTHFNENSGSIKSRKFLD
jgi:hypothetical protein